MIAVYTDLPDEALLHLFLQHVKGWTLTAGPTGPEWRDDEGKFASDPLEVGHTCADLEDIVAALDAAGPWQAVRERPGKFHQNRWLPRGVPQDMTHKVVICPTGKAGSGYGFGHGWDRNFKRAALVALLNQRHVDLPKTWSGPAVTV